MEEGGGVWRWEAVGEWERLQVCGIGGHWEAVGSTHGERHWGHWEALGNGGDCRRVVLRGTGSTGEHLGCAELGALGGNGGTGERSECMQCGAPGSTWGAWNWEHWEVMGALGSTRCVVPGGSGGADVVVVGYWDVLEGAGEHRGCNALGGGTPRGCGGTGRAEVAAAVGHHRVLGSTGGAMWGWWLWVTGGCWGMKSTGVDGGGVPGGCMGARGCGRH